LGREKIAEAPRTELYNLDLRISMKAFEKDAFAKLKPSYKLAGADRSNLAYGYIAKAA